jgi:hypothetical protein
MTETNVSLKLFIDKKRQRVLFVEANKKFVDFLLSIFTLPVRAVTRLLKEGGLVVGSLPSLYRSIKNLGVTSEKLCKMLYSKFITLQDTIVSYIYIDV